MSMAQPTRGGSSSSISSSSMNYLVTASKATAVSHALVAPIVSSEHNLVLVKRTRVEVVRMSPGLEAGSVSSTVLLECSLNARVSSLYSLPQRASPLHALLIVSERHRVTLVSYDVAAARLVTRSTMDVREPLQQAGEVAPLSTYEPTQQLLALHHYTGQLKIVAVTASNDLEGHESLSLAEPVTLRLEESRVLDLAWIGPGQLAVLYEDSHQKRHVRTYALAPTRRSLLEGSWSLPNVDSTSDRLVPVLSGVLVLGMDTLVFHAGSATSAPQSLSVRRMRVRAHCVLPGDPCRVLLADHVGRLHVLLLSAEGGRVRVHVELLGTTVTASALAYLGSSHVFVGSSLGDSECVRLSTSPLSDGSYVQRAQRFPSLAPIVDMALVDPEQQGQAQIVACSGAFKDGSLRLVRYGVAVSEHARVDLAGIKGMWALDATLGLDTPTPSTTSSSGPEQHLVLSFADETRVLALRDEELTERDSHGLDAKHATLLAGTVHVEGIKVAVQVTALGVHVLDLSLAHGSSLAHWQPPPGAPITAAAPLAPTPNNDLVAVACGARVVLLRLSSKSVQEVAVTALEHDVSALALDLGSGLVAATLWGDFSLRLLRLSDLAPLQRVHVGAETIARSLLFAQLGDEWQLFVALGDGQLVSYALESPGPNPKANPKANPNVVRESSRRAVTLGTRPLSLHALPSSTSSSLLVCGDRPALVSRGPHGRVQYSQVNLRELGHACALRARAFPGALAFATGDALLIGALESTQRLHERAVPLGELARRIAHLEHAKAYAATTLRLESDAQGREQERSYVRLWSSHTLEALDSYALLPHELGNALLATTLTTNSANGAQGEELLIVGTTIDSGDAALPERGRVLVFEVRSTRLVLVAELTLNGAVFALDSLRSQRLVAAVNNEVHVYRWEREAGAAPRLALECSARGFKLALSLAVRGDIVLVGDLIKSAVMLRYEPGSLKELARDYAPAWTVAVALQDDERALVSENAYNLYALRRHVDALSDEERARLDVSGEYHLGDQVNRMRHGSLVMPSVSASVDAMAAMLPQRLPSLVLGAVSGAVYVCAQLDAHPTLYALLEALQRAMQRSSSPLLAPLGGMRHDEWRAFENERRVAPARGFLDGDLLESFLDLPQALQSDLAAEMQPPAQVHELVARLEALARALH